MSRMTGLPLGKRRYSIGAVGRQGRSGYDTARARRRDDPSQRIRRPRRRREEEISRQACTFSPKRRDASGAWAGRPPPTATPFHIAQTGLRVPTCVGSYLLKLEAPLEAASRLRGARLPSPVVSSPSTPPGLA